MAISISVLILVIGLSRSLRCRWNSILILHLPRVRQRQLHRCRRRSRIEQCHHAVGREYQRCGEHDVHQLYRHQCRFCHHTGLLQAGHGPRHGCGERTEPRIQGAGTAACRSDEIGVTTQKRQTSFLQIGCFGKHDGRYDQTFLANYLDINVIPQIKRIEGVGDVMELGDTYSMRIWLKPERMAQYGLVPSDVTAVLGEQNIEAPTGSLGENSKNVFQFTMKYRGRLKSVEEFQNTVVRSQSDGSVLRLKDVADVELGTLTYSFRSEMDSKPAVLFMMFQTAGSNATAVNKQITAQIDEMRKSLPEGTEFVTMMSSNDFLFASIHEVIKTLIEAFILVFIVVYIFLQDMRSTLIPAIAIPVALIATFFVLKLIGFSINLLTFRPWYLPLRLWSMMPSSSSRRPCQAGPGLQISPYSSIDA